MAAQRVCYRINELMTNVFVEQSRLHRVCSNSFWGWNEQNFCLPFLYYFNIQCILIETSKIPIIENSRMWQHLNKDSKPSGFYSEKPVYNFTKWFWDRCKIYFIFQMKTWENVFSWIFSVTMCRHTHKCLRQFLGYCARIKI